MFMVREVINCHPGKVGGLVGKFKALGEVMEDMGFTPFRIYTDVAGEPFWTVVLQSEHEKLADFHETEAKVMSDDRARSVMAGYHDLISKGRREIYKVEA
jgi:hypothetical protein